MGLDLVLSSAFNLIVIRFEVGCALVFTKGLEPWAMAACNLICLEFDSQTDFELDVKLGLEYNMESTIWESTKVKV